MTATAHRAAAPATGRRRAGYLVGAGVNAVLLYLVNVSPGWEAVPFLTARTPEVLPLVNASLLAGVLANLVYAVRDPRWLVLLGDVVTTSIGLAAVLRVWDVFPLDFEAGAWETVARVLLVIGAVGSVLGIVVALVRLANPATRTGRGRPR
jgi:hypothetical protein